MFTHSLHVSFCSRKMSDNIEVSHEYLIKDVKICSDNIIGSGSYAVVYVATYHATKVAAKKLHSIFFEGVDPKEYRGVLQSWLNEFKLMHSLRHPNIVQFYGVFNSDNPSGILLNGSSYIITELLAKSLQARNVEKPRLTIRHIINITMDIAAGLCYLHNRQNPIMHRDLASKNVLLSAAGQAKIADLGVAKFAKQIQQSHTRHPGTDYYMPLETVIAGDNYDHSIDVYALGVIILEMATGKEPTATQGLKRVGKTFEIVPETERRKNDFDELEKSPSAVFKKLIMLCLEERETRISAGEVTMHLDELKNSETYQSCEVSAVFEIMKKTDDASHEYQHKLKEIQQENERLIQENERLKQDVEILKNEKESLKLQAHEEKSNFQNRLAWLEKQGSTTPKSIVPQMQQKAQYVPSGPQQLPQVMASTMVVPKHHSNRPPSNFAYTGSLEKSHIQSMSYSYDQAPRPLRSFDQPPRSLHSFDQPPRSLHSFDQPPRSLHSFGQPPRSLHSFGQPPRLLHSSDQPPRSLHRSDQPPRSLHSSDQPPRSLHSFDQPPRSLHSSDQPPRSLHSFDQPPESFPSFNQHPKSLHYQRSESWSSDTIETPTLDNIVDGDFLSRNCQLDDNFISLPARLSDDPAIQKAREYLTYQLSCMDRVMMQLKSATSNTSENLVTSFVETLKEHINKTADYIIKLPNHIKTDQYLHEPLQKIYRTLSIAHFDKISYKYTQDLNVAIRNLQDALNRCIQRL